MTQNVHSISEAFSLCKMTLDWYSALIEYFEWRPIEVWSLQSLCGYVNCSWLWWMAEHWVTSNARWWHSERPSVRWGNDRWHFAGIYKNVAPLEDVILCCPLLTYVRFQCVFSTYRFKELKNKTAGKINRGYIASAWRSRHNQLQRPYSDVFSGLQPKIFLD